MEVHVSKHSVDRVMSTLVAQDKLVSIAELQVLTGLSYNTIRAALHVGGAISDNDYPAHYGAGDWVLSPVGNARAEHGLIVPQSAEPDGLPARWNANREVFGARLGELFITAESDPQTLYKLFASGATTLATMASLLEKVKDKPDWFELLMGEDNA